MIILILEEALEWNFYGGYGTSRIYSLGMLDVQV